MTDDYSDLMAPDILAKVLSEKESTSSGSGATLELTLQAMEKHRLAAQSKIDKPTDPIASFVTAADREEWGQQNKGKSGNPSSEDGGPELVPTTYVEPKPHEPMDDLMDRSLLPSPSRPGADVSLGALRRGRGRGIDFDM